MQIDPSTLPWREAYKLLIGSVLPRPIAWVSTVGTDGSLNLAPFSFFTGICANPLTICFAPMVSGETGGKKDTLRNIEATGEFVVNIVTEENAPGMNETATAFPPEVSEFDAVGLTPVPSVAVRPPRVAESPIHLECTCRQIIALSEEPGGGWLVLGQVVRIHLQDKLYQAGRIDTGRLRPVGRLAGNAYARVTDTFELVRKTAPRS